MGAFGEPLVSGCFDAVCSRTVLAYMLAFLVLTYLSVVLGELVPKALALRAPRDRARCSRARSTSSRA